jgi:hypothetical protein
VELTSRALGAHRRPASHAAPRVARATGAGAPVDLRLVQGHDGTDRLFIADAVELWAGDVHYFGPVAEAYGRTVRASAGWSISAPVSGSPPPERGPRVETQQPTAAPNRPHSGTPGRVSPSPRTTVASRLGLLRAAHSGPRRRAAAPPELARPAHRPAAWRAARPETPLAVRPANRRRGRHIRGSLVGGTAACRCPECGVPPNADSPWSADDCGLSHGAAGRAGRRCPAASPACR